MAPQFIALLAVYAGDWPDELRRYASSAPITALASLTSYFYHERRTPAVAANLLGFSLVNGITLRIVSPTRPHEEVALVDPSLEEAYLLAMGNQDVRV